MSDGVVETFLVIGAIFVLAAASAAALDWGGIKVPPIAQTKPRLVVGALGVVVLVVAAIGAFTHAGSPSGSSSPAPVALGSSQQSAVGSATTSVTPQVTSAAPSPTNGDASAPAAPASGPGSVARQGTLTVRAYVAVDLDSSAPDWGAVQGDWKGIRDLVWDGDPTSVGIAGGSANVALLGAAAPSDFTACSTAPTGGDPAAGDGLHVGERFCIQTGRHLVLLTVTAVNPSVNGSPATLAMNAIVWNE